MKFKKILISIIIVMGILCSNVHANNKEYDTNNDTVIKVGFYDYKPYYYVDKDGKLRGYYAELLDLISKNMNIKYEYVKSDFSDSLKNLENESIDLLFGLNITPEREENFNFSETPIALEQFGIYTKKNIKSGDLSKLNNMRLGVTEDALNSKWIIEFLKSKHIDINPVWLKGSSELINALDNDTVEATFIPIKNDTHYNLAYEYTAGPVYIAASKNNLSLINELDQTFKDPILDKKIAKLYNKYFKYTKKEKIERIIIFLAIILMVFLGIVTLYPKMIDNKIKKKIRHRMKNKEYLIYYQPIYSPRNTYIIGFEALLRLQTKKYGIIPPYKFIPEIEDNNMLYEVTLWILKNVLNDYYKIIKYDNIKNKDFYISINLSLKEIENEKFIKEAIKMLNNSGIPKSKICLEIVERVKIDNVSKIKRSIKTLKDAGFIIAIDDFGIEYSNLDILRKIEFDIIKLDKYFIDEIYDCEIKEEILTFISNISKKTNKSLVIEGVEDEHQNEIVKSINNDNVYIQGYFYNKPMPIEDIKNI